MTTVTDYDTDFYLWTQQQAALLRQGEFSRMDIENIAEEIESMGRSQSDAVRSFLRNILMHLLKWQHQPERRCVSWEITIDNGRDEIRWRLKKNPSLKSQLVLLIEDAYPQARRNASRETGLPLAIFPEQSPFTLDETIGDYWPD